MAYVRERNPAAANAMLERIRRSAGRLADHPRSGRAGRVTGTRELVVPDTPYVVPYRLVGETVQLLRVLHGAQRWPDLL